MGRRAAILYPIVLAALSMLGPFSIDTPFPAFEQIQSDFSVGPETTQQIVSAYLLAFAAMSLFHGPISDSVGRKPVMIVGLLGYSVASVVAAFAPNAETLIACRVVQGLTAGGGVIVSRAMVREIYSGDEAQKMMSRIMMIFSLGPAVAPIIGGWLLQLGSWHIIFWFLTFVGVALSALVAFTLPETLPTEDRRPLRLGSVVGSVFDVAKSGAFQRIAWAGALTFGSQFLYIGSAAIVVVDLLGRGETDFWVLFGPIVLGVLAGSWLSGRLAGVMSRERTVTLGWTFAAFAAAVNLVLALIPATQTLPWAVVGPALIAFGATTSFPTQQLILLDMFPHARGAAASAATFCVLALNGLGAGLLAPLVTGSLAELAAASLAMVLGGLALWTWHLIRTKRRRPVRDDEWCERSSEVA